MTKQFLYIIIVVLVLSGHVTAQQKYEREYRIKDKDVPASALGFVEQLGFEDKIKWYQEESLDHTSIEAKTLHENKDYSIEFSVSGEIEDIEVIAEIETLPRKAQETILNYFKSAYDRVKICKIQVQYTGDDQDLIAFLSSGETGIDTAIATHYEIVVRAKKGRVHEKLEYLFSTTGEVIRRSVIILKNTDNLEY